MTVPGLSKISYRPFLAFLIVISCSNNPNNSEPHYVSFPYQGIQREYLLHLPPHLAPKAPLVFVLHGYTGTADDYERWIKMDSVADANGFAVVYPQGSRDSTGNPHWNAGLSISSVDDKGFLSELARALQSRYDFDTSRTFTCGVSNGGFMSYYLVSEFPGIFKAAASITGTMSGVNWQNRNSIAPSSILQISGKLDTTVPIDGSMSAPGGWGGAPDMNTVIDFWRTLNKCTSADTVQVNGHTMAYKYGNGINGNKVWYYLVDDLAHETPIGYNGRINSSAVVWEFFSR
jgi:polyhydroxybutyrate depolymerase